MSPRTYVPFGMMLAATLWTGVLFAQGGQANPPAQPGGGAPPAGGAPTAPAPGRGTPTAPGRTNIPNTQQPNDRQPQMPPQPIFVTGRVMLEDGTPPPDSVVIENVCNGSAHAEGYTDTKGYFSVELGGRNNGVLQDASEFGSPGGFPGSPGNSSNSPFGSPSGGMMSRGGGMENRFFNCELRAKLAGYRSQTVSLAMRRPLDDPNVGVILLHRLTPNEGGTISAISLSAPKDARKAYEKGLDAIKKKKADDAVKNFQKAVEIYPKYATAWYDLGRVESQQGHAEEAKQSFQKAIEADPKYVNPYLDLSMIAARAQNWQEVADLTAKMVKLDPFSFPQAFFFNSVANYNLKNIDVAEKSAREATRLDTRHLYPKSSHLLGVILAQRNDFPAAAEEFRNYLKFAKDAPDVETVKKQLEEVEKLSGAAKQPQ